MKLAQRLSRIHPSATLALNAKARDMKAAGEDVVSLTAGEPDFDTPSHIVDAMKDALDRGETRYTAVPGIAPLRQAVARRYEDFGITAEQTVISTGGKQAIFNAALCTLEPGDQVIIPAPYWLSYADIVRFCGAEPVVLPTDESTGFSVRPEQLANAMTDRTRMVIVNSPSNPSGAMLSADDLWGLVSVLRPRDDVWLLFDEIYDRLVYEGTFTSPFEVAPELAHRFIVINGGSKTYAMTGIRIGYAVGPVELIQAMSKLQGQSTSNASAPSQYGLLAALEGDQGCVETMRQAFLGRRDRMVERLEAMPDVSCYRPHGAFYCFPRVSGLFGRRPPNGRPIEGASDVAAYLLASEKVVVVPGEPFGSPDHVRLSYAVSDDVAAEALTRMARAFAALT
jgi:aspartate aminotransferase